MEEQSDGSIIVSGLCTSDTVDLDDQIIDLDFSRKGLAEWASSFGNVRQMHSTNLPPAGKAISVDTTRPEGVYLTARIVEPGAVKLTKEGVYSAFSVGISKPRIIRDKVAKNGRVTDGVFSEVSIVDFPALPTAKFSIVKRSKTEIKKLEKTLTPIGTIVKNHDPSDEKDQTQMNENIIDAEVVEKAHACDACDGSGTGADGSECKKCMGKGVAVPEIEKSDEPVVEKKKGEDDDEDGDDDSDKGSDDDDDDDDDEKLKKSIEGIPYAVRRAHDALCDAFSDTVIAATHPSVEKNGYKSVVDPDLIRSILAGQADQADATQIASLAAALGSAQALVSLTDAELAAAHTELHKAFADAYPQAHPTPANVKPGQFQRPFLTTGRAPLNSTGATPRIPVSNAQIDADDFTRNPLTEGHQNASPANTGSRLTSNATAADQIAAASKDSAMSALAALHDHITSAYPSICPLGAGNGQGSRAGFSNAGVETIDMEGGIRSIAAGATPQLTKAEKKVLKKAKQLAQAKKLVKAAAKAEKKAALLNDDATADRIEKGVKIETNSDGEVLIDTDTLREIVKSLVMEVTKGQLDSFDAVLSSVQSEVERLASEPDPAKAPVRGTVVLERAVEKSASEADKLRKSAEDAFKEQVDYLTTLTKSGNPELRMRAEHQLATLLERSVLAETSDNN